MMGVRHLTAIFLILFATTATSAADTKESEVSFRSRQSTFTTDLLEPSSLAFQTRAALIKGQLEPFFLASFSSYQSMTVHSFRNGSVINDFNVTFLNTFVPHHTTIANVLVNASSKVIGFDIETSSITVDNIVSGGVNHKISLFSSLCLALLSWLLSSKQ